MLLLRLACDIGTLGGQTVANTISKTTSQTYTWVAPSTCSGSVKFRALCGAGGSIDEMWVAEEVTEAGCTTTTSSSESSASTSSTDSTSSASSTTSAGSTSTVASDDAGWWFQVSFPFLSQRKELLVLTWLAWRAWIFHKWDDVVLPTRTLRLAESRRWSMAPNAFSALNMPGRCRQA